MKIMNYEKYRTKMINNFRTQLLGQQSHRNANPLETAFFFFDQMNQDQDKVLEMFFKNKHKQQMKQEHGLLDKDSNLRQEYYHKE